MAQLKKRQLGCRTPKGTPQKAGPTEEREERPPEGCRYNSKRKKKESVFLVGTEAPKEKRKRPV
jgi:hypothetical protein